MIKSEILKQIKLLYSKGFNLHEFDKYIHKKVTYLSLDDDSSYISFWANLNKQEYYLELKLSLINNKPVFKTYKIFEELLQDIKSIINKEVVYFEIVKKALT